MPDRPSTPNPAADAYASGPYAGDDVHQSGPYFAEAYLSGPCAAGEGETHASQHTSDPDDGFHPAEESSLEPYGGDAYGSGQHGDPHGDQHGDPHGGTYGGTHGASRGGQPASPGRELPSAETRPVRVLVADDNPVVRAGVHSLLQGRNDLRVVAEASDGREAYDLAGRTRPDAILLDVRMPGVDGISALPQLARLAPVMMLTYSRESEIVHESLRLGARGYLVHGEFTADELVAYVRDLTRGRAPFTATSAHALLEQARGRPAGTPLPDGLGGNGTAGQATSAATGQQPSGATGTGGAAGTANSTGTGGVRRRGLPKWPREAQTPERTPPGVKQSAVERRRWATGAHTQARRASYGLSEREVEIMGLIVSGMTNTQIAATCFISEKTVKNHINRIFTKLEANTRSQAIARWLGTTRTGQDW